MKSCYLFLLIFTRICAVFETETMCPFETTPSLFVLARKVSDCTANEIENCFGEGIVEIMRKVRSVHDAFQNLEKSTSVTRFDGIPRHFNMFLTNMQLVDNSFEDLVEFSSDGGENQSDCVDNSTVDFIEVVSDRFRVVNLTSIKVHNFVVSDKKQSLENFIKWLAENPAAQDEIVRTTQQSPQQWLYNFCGKIALVQIKSLVMVQLPYALKVVKNDIEKGRFGNIIDEFQARLKTVIEKAKVALPKVSKEYWRFDPKEYKRDENYLEITKLLQGYVVNEKVLNKGGACYGNCSIFKETRIVNCRDDQNCINQRPCTGEVYDCVNLKHMHMNICPAPHSTRRRYSYIEYEDRTLLGEKTSCSNPIAKLDAWIGWCPYCMCLCDDVTYSARYVSLKRAMSDINVNKVVTGVRFVRKNNLLHLQVQQGELLPYGLINITTLEWVPVNNFNMRQRYVYGMQDYIQLGRKRNTIDLHVKVVERETPKRLVTGVRFSVLKTDRNHHLNLQIRETSFDFPTGKLYLKSSQWTKNFQTEFSSINARTKISIDNLDVSTRSPTENIVKSKGVQYIEFTPTSIEKDAAQTTVPLIDAQDVVPSVPTPLIGAGLYYKAAEGYGGFIGLKIVTYDFSEDL